MDVNRRRFIQIAGAGAIALGAKPLLGMIPKENPYKRFTELLGDTEGLEGVRAVVDDLKSNELDRTAMESLVGPRYKFKGIVEEQEFPFSLYKLDKDHEVGSLPLSGLAFSMIPKYSLGKGWYTMASADGSPFGRADLHKKIRDKAGRTEDLDDIRRTPDLAHVINSLTRFRPGIDEKSLALYIKHLYGWRDGIVLDQDSMLPISGEEFIDISYDGFNKDEKVELDNITWRMTAEKDGNEDHLVFPNRVGSIDDIFVPWGLVPRFKRAKVELKAENQNIALLIPLDEYIKETEGKDNEADLPVVNADGTKINLWTKDKYTRPNGKTLGLLMDLIYEGTTSTQERIERAVSFSQRYLPYKHTKIALEDTRTPLQSLINGTKDCSDGSVILASMLLNRRIGIEPIFIYEQYGDNYHVAVGIPAEAIKNNAGETIEYKGKKYLYTETTKVLPIGIKTDGYRLEIEQARSPDLSRPKWATGARPDMWYDNNSSD